MAFPRLVHSSTKSEPLSERSDDELMRLAQGGSRAAFATLVERHARRVVHLCSRFVNDTQIGQELAQETWVRVWQNRDRYRTDGGFRPWLVTIARNQCRNHVRRKGIAKPRLDAAEHIDAAATDEQIDQVLVTERREQVRAALGRLSPPMREALLLRYAEELRYDEMTVALGAGESTLRSRVHHGLKILKRSLENQA